MLKLVTVCGAGVGSSVMEKMFAEEILADHHIDGTVEAADISSVVPDLYDGVITTSDFAALLDTKTPIIRLDNLLDKAAMESQILALVKGGQA